MSDDYGIPGFACTGGLSYRASVRLQHIREVISEALQLRASYIDSVLFAMHPTSGSELTGIGAILEVRVVVAEFLGVEFGANAARLCEMSHAIEGRHQGLKIGVSGHLGHVQPQSVIGLEVQRTERAQSCQNANDKLRGLVESRKFGDQVTPQRLDLSPFSLLHRTLQCKGLVRIRNEG